MHWSFLLAIVFGSTLLFSETSLPNGTILPVTLEHTLRAAQAKPGDVAVLKIAQDVPLGGGQVLHAGTRVNGRVVKVFRSRQGLPAKVAIALDSVRVDGKELSVRTNLRAIAGFMEVEQAGIPTNGDDRGTPATAWTTRQIGGDVVYRGGGPVTNERNQAVGTPVYNGVSSRVSADPNSNCRAEIDGNSKPQSLWVFSSDACGVYGMSNVEILHAGRTDPVGEFVIGAKTGELKIPAGTALLLRVDEVTGSQQASSRTH